MQELSYMSKTFLQGYFLLMSLYTLSGSFGLKLDNLQTQEMCMYPQKKGTNCIILSKVHIKAELSCTKHS